MAGPPGSPRVPRFVGEVVELRPGAVRDPRGWAGSLVVVERGEIVVRCAGGGRCTFVAGDTIFVDGLEIVAVANEAATIARVAAIGRSPTDESTGRVRSEGRRRMRRGRAMAITGPDGTVRGALIEPGDAGYDEARSVFYGGIDKHPAAIVRVADAADVARVVTHARETGAELAVRSGGHSVAGHSVSEGGLVIDLSGLKALEIDPDARTAWAETGLTAGEVTSAAAEHGLAIGFGDTGSVGIGGITLGGGVGYLVREHGLTIDSLSAAEVVTADGEIRSVDEEHEPDLFWALRGGGGNFGVATRFRFRLAEVPSVVGGMLILPATVESVEGFVAALEAAPEALSGIANVMPAPPMPFLPEERVGSLVIFALLCFAGEAARAERALAPFRALGEPLADLLREMPYPGMYQPEDPDYHPLAVSRTLLTDGFDAEAAKVALERLEASDAPLRVVQVRALGGAVARVPNEATAFAHRHRRLMINVAAFYETDAERDERQRWVDDLSAEVQRGEVAAYVNFLGDEGPDRVRDAYPGRTLERLRAIKAEYDPTNLFRLNQNIHPSQEPPR